MEKRIFKIAVTGGPCAGKTTLLDKIRREATNISNVKVFFAKEAATLIKHCGINFMDAGGDSTFQELIIEQQVLAEDRAFRVANRYSESHPDTKVIIICDRGIMDGEAYFDSPSDFAKILLRYSLTKEIVYARYDAVICLRSAAIGAREFYTTMDGTPRDESIDEAAMLDKKVCAAWKGHEKYTEIDNSFKFYEKLDKAISKIFAVASVEIPKEICKRYVVETPNLFELVGKRNSSLFVDQTFFLKESDANSVSAIKIRRSGDNPNYFLSNQRWDFVKNPISNEMVEAAVVDTVFCIGEKEFINYLKNVDSSVKILEKMTYSFYIGASVHCEIDLFLCNQNRAYLKAYFDADTKENRELIENSFEIVREVTYNKSYCEREIARTEGEVLNNQKQV